MNAVENLNALVAAFPTPAVNDGKLAEVDKDATDRSLAELLKGGREAVLGLVGLLVPPEKGGDTQARHALHALVIHVGGTKNDKQRQEIAETLASALEGDRPKEIRAFIVGQLRLVGGKEVVAALGKVLLDEDLCEHAAMALQSIRDGAAEQLRAALPRAKGRQLRAVVQALAALRDEGSVELLRKSAGDGDREVRLTALWGLANLTDAGSVALLLKAADASGHERIKATQACLLLAENLLAAGKKREAAQVYTHLRDTRTDASEKYVRDAAVRGLEKV